MEGGRDRIKTRIFLFECPPPPLPTFAVKEGGKKKHTLKYIKEILKNDRKERHN